MFIVSKFKKINWIGEILTPATVILMEVFFAYPWLVFSGKLSMLSVQQTPLGILSIILLIGISYLLTRLLTRRKLPLYLIQTIIILCGLGAVLVTLGIEYGSGFDFLSGQWFIAYGNVILDSFSKLHPFVFAIPAALYFWWYGIRLNRSSLYFEKIYSSFIIRLVLLVFLFIIWGIILKPESFSNVTSDIGLYVAGFFFFGLVAMALANLHAIQERLRAKGEVSKAFGRQWLSIIISIIGGIILTGIGIASAFSPDFISSIGRVINSAADILYRILYYILLPLGYLAEILVYIGKFLVNLIRGDQQTEPLEFNMSENPEDLTEVTGGAISPDLLMILKWVILGLVLLGVVFLISKTIIRRHSAKNKDEIEEEQESLWSWDGFKSDLLIFFRMLFQRFRRKEKPAREIDSPEWTDDEYIRGKLSIREIYRHLIRQAARLRMPRERHETPYEYAGRLCKFVPEGRESLDKITNLYIGVRYGEQETDPGNLDEANAIWEKLRSIMDGIESI